MNAPSINCFSHSSLSIQDGKTWYIMDSAWITSWLAHVHYDPQNAPAPGPCNNRRLIAYDYADRKYVFRFAMQMAVKDRAGDYRRVSAEVWNKFKEYYPQSGPAITMQFFAKDRQKSGFYDPSCFNILDTVEPPEDANDDEKQQKKKKKKLFAFKKKQEAEVKAKADAEKQPTEEEKGIEPVDAPSSTAAGASSKKSATESGVDALRAPDSDDDSDHNDSPAVTSSLLKGTRARAKDSDDDSDDEAAPGKSPAKSSSSNISALLKSSNTRIEPKSVGMGGNYARVSESVKKEQKDDAVSHDKTTSSHTLTHLYVYSLCIVLRESFPVVKKGRWSWLLSIEKANAFCMERNGSTTVNCTAMDDDGL